ncbi:hypothetical protein Bca4012_008538 [Brassica carinata]
MAVPSARRQDEVRMQDEVVTLASNELVLQEKPFINVSSKLAKKASTSLVVVIKPPIITSNPYDLLQEVPENLEVNETLMIPLESKSTESKEIVMYDAKKTVSPTTLALTNRIQKKRKLRNSPPRDVLLPLEWKDTHPTYNFYVESIMVRLDIENYQDLLDILHWLSTLIGIIGSV